MPRDQSRNQINNSLTYQKQVPKFLQNFGQPAPSRSPPPEHHPNYRGPQGAGRGGREGREAIPERPREGQWAGGSDDEEAQTGRGRRRPENDSDDEWGEVFGGGGEEGPQVVVLKEGRHLTAEEVKRERRRAAGKASRSPSPAKDVGETSGSNPPTVKSEKTKPTIIKATASSAKRKLVGTADSETGQAGDNAKDGKSGAASGPKKKKKAAKGLLSFDEAEGES